MKWKRKRILLFNSGNKIDYKDKLILKVNIYMVIEKKEKNRVISEGDYLFYTKINGKGYDLEGNIIYELINGKGKVLEYSGNKLLFEGEYVNGLKNGKGKEYGYRDRLVYE